MTNAQFKKEVKRITGFDIKGYNPKSKSENTYYWDNTTRNYKTSYELQVCFEDGEFNCMVRNCDTREDAYDQIIAYLELIVEHGNQKAFNIWNGFETAEETTEAELIETELKKELTLEECQELKLRAYDFYRNAENGSKDYYKGHELLMLAMDKLDAKEKEPQKGEKMENMNTITVTAFKDERVIEVPTINGLQFKWQQEEAVATLESLRRRKVDLKGMNNLKNHDGFNYLTSNHKFEKARKKLALAHLSAYAVYLKEMGE